MNNKPTAIDPIAVPFAGKTVVITGANRGIGQSIASLFCLQGADVLACCREIPIPSPMDSDQITWISLDLTDDQSIQQAIQNIRSKSRIIDILVNCAGVGSGSLFAMTSMAEIRRVFEVNFFGTLAFTQPLSRMMMRQKQGVIINISSISAQHVQPGSLTYGASKSALERATLSLAKELGDYGVRVNAIAPGVTETDLAEQMDPEARKKLTQSAIFNNASKPIDIAHMVSFLASNQAKQMTGQILHVDGGII